MPLEKSHSAKARSANIAELRRAGYPAQQAAAIAYRVNGEDDEPRRPLRRKGRRTPRPIKTPRPVSHASDALSFAYDKESGRHYDADGRLHVALSNISKANVCPYYGYEIPQFKKLGLRPDAVYHLLRDPEELRKAIPTFNRVPLLDVHVPAMAKSLPKEHIIGTMGDLTAFNEPYLQNSLTVWDGEAIAGIETKEQHELSCSYRYRADMTPGVHEGVHYDGVMRDIVGNHVAVIPIGRAGADIAVGDSTPPEFTIMKQNVLAMRVALVSYLKPSLANDGTPIPLRDLVQPGMSPTAVANAVVKQYTTKVVTNKADLIEVLQGAADAAQDMAAEDEDEEEDEEAGGEDRKRGKDRAKDRKRAGDDLEPRGRRKAPAGEDATRRIESEDDEEDDEEEEENGERGKISKDKRGRDKVPVKDRAKDRVAKDRPAKDRREEAEDRRAHDAALLQQGRVLAMSDFKAARQAEDDVRPLVGELAAMDSAEATYRFALEQSGADLRGVHPSAFRSMVQLLVANKSATPAVSSQSLAMDANVVTEFNVMFPRAAKPGRW